MKYIKYSLFLGVIVLSFYFTDKIMIYIDNKNPIMREIKESEKKYESKSVNAIISDNVIIPGIYGKDVDERRSLSKMNDFGSFNDTFFIYNYLKPNISLEDNKDKIIISGNPIKRSVSLIVLENDSNEDYLNSLNIKYNYIAKLNSNLSIKREYINGEDDIHFSDLNSVFKKNNLYNNICLIDYSNINLCKDKEMFLVKYSVSSDNIYDCIDSIKSGVIILITKGTTLDNLKLIINEIERQDLKIVYLSELIDEKV